MKNLKMFAISLLAFLVMASGVHAATTCDPDDYVAGATVNGRNQCYATGDMSGLITGLASKDSKVTEITLLQNYTLGSNLQVANTLTLDLNGNNITVTGGKITVLDGGSLTIKGDGSRITSTNVSNVFEVQNGGSLSINGSKGEENLLTITASDAGVVPAHATKALFSVIGGSNSKKTTLTVGEYVDVTTKGAGIVVYPAAGPDSAPGEAKNVTVNANGTWEAKDYVIQVYGRVKKSSSPAVINVEGGSFTSTESFGFYASGYAEWNVSAGSIEGSDAMVVRSGDINISGTAALNGTSNRNSALDSGHDGEAAKGAALRLSGDDRSPVGETNKVMDINISGGKFTTEYNNGYAVYVEDAVTTAPVKISGGEFTSDGDNAAIYINTEAFIDAHESSITGGVFANAIVGDVSLTSGGHLIGAGDILAKGTDFKTENGVITVGSGSNIPKDPVNDPDDQPTTNPDDQPGNTGDANTPSDGTTGRLPDEPAKTNDNILVYASLALVSALSIKFTNKKRA